MSRSFYYGTDYPESYLHITLTDEEDVPEALGRLRTVYPYIMKLSYDNARTRARQNPLQAEAMPETSPLELFGLLYEKQNNRALGDDQRAYLTGLIESIWKEEA